MLNIKMLIALVTVILLIIGFIYYIKWANEYYATLDKPGFDAVTKKTIKPADKRASWKYTVLPPRAVANSYNYLYYNYNYYSVKYF
jgi:hypothetical protein